MDIINMHWIMEYYAKRINKWAINSSISFRILKETIKVLTNFSRNRVYVVGRWNPFHENKIINMIKNINLDILKVEGFPKNHFNIVIQEQ